MTQLLFQKVTSQCEWKSLVGRRAQRASICTHPRMCRNHANSQVSTSVEGRPSGGDGTVGNLWSETAQKPEGRGGK